MNYRENYEIDRKIELGRQVEKKVLGHTIWGEEERGREEIWREHLKFVDREFFYDIAATHQPLPVHSFPRDVKRFVLGGLKIPEGQIRFFTAVDSPLDYLGIDAWFETYILDPRTKELKIFKVNLDITTNFQRKLDEVLHPSSEQRLYYPKPKLIGNEIMEVKRFDRRRLRHLQDPGSFVPFEPEIIIFGWPKDIIRYGASQRAFDVATAVYSKMRESITNFLESKRITIQSKDLGHLITIPQEDLKGIINEIDTERQVMVQNATIGVENMASTKERKQKVKECKN